jgi:hypothetical protein
MKSLLLTAVAALASTLAIAAHAAPPASEKDKAQAIIWAKEQAVYEGRAKGSLSTYVTNSVPEYLGWPPYSRVPYGTDGIQMNEKSWAGETKERLTMEFKGFTLKDKTALIYYDNHRTSLPDGTAVDQHWEIIHVWVKDGADWKLLGGMQRAGGLERAKPH